MPGVVGGIPQTFTGMHAHTLNPLQGGATGAGPLATARGSPLGAFSGVPTGRSLFPRLLGTLLAGFPDLRSGSQAGFLLRARNAGYTGGGRPLGAFARDGGGLSTLRRG